MINTSHFYCFFFSDRDPNTKGKESVVSLFFYADINNRAMNSVWTIILQMISVLNQLLCSSFLPFDFRAKIFIIVEQT